MFNTVNRTFRSIALGGIAIAALAATPAYAAETTTTLSSTATVTSNCNISTTAVAFGSVNVVSGLDVDATGGLSVTCTSGTAWSASADAGAGTLATMAVRKMANGTNMLNYALYTDSARTTVWGNAADATTVKFSGTGNGSAQASTIYARVPSSQTSLPAGSYADTVTVTY